MYSFLRELLFLLPAELSHDVALGGLRLASQLRLMSPVPLASEQPVEVMGLSFPNPVGLAAGLDKNGEYIDAMAAMGFGFLEVGTITPRAQPGNPKPRLFRLREAQAIINRMGFNNQGLDALLERLESTRYLGVLGVNIGKNKDTPLEQAADDYLSGLRAVYAHADYITVNISSPNTPGLRQLQEGQALSALLSALKKEQKILSNQHERYVPLAVKVAPDLEAGAIQEVADILLENQIDGLIATNTTLDKAALQGVKHSEEQGGLSGKPLTERSTAVIAEFRQYLQEDIPIMGVGGIMSAQDALAKREAGAKLIQLYSGFIYGGPGLVKECVKAWC